MPLKSTQSAYGAVAVTIHWLSVLFIIALAGSGFLAAGMEDTAAKAAVLRAHVPCGIVILLLTAARAGWWLLADRKPDPVPMPDWQDRVSRGVHFLFYVVIFGMGASGIAMMVLSGAGLIIFGGTGETLPDFRDFGPRIPHGVGARLFIALFVFHAGAALHHHFVKRDGLLRRMWR
ncbi:cytochrome b [Parasphingopyxis lamellibrachiae]|uniref:Cytochrome b561 n=1 Tax=Parasphingopyxis lamellibrachiae TaxID=680125 RepID=A0A3D9FDD1_9SPHN|nr:cytochrome b/b6 domain-containing protein [Parasphingopyxis lamellibrachiae]RED15789.1 cytochrome b561 [Parasphingopyxis lamellibrachiae]